MKRILPVLLGLVSALAFSATLAPVQLLNPSGSTAGQAIVSTGASSAPAWGSITLGGLGSIAANSVVANATASSAAPAAFAMPSCSTSSSALQWMSGTGFTCGTVASAGANSNITSLAAGTTLNTPTITGVTSGACAAAGNIGECKNSNVVQGSAVSLTNNVAANVTSVSLTAGDWLCYGNVGFNPAGTTVTSQELGWISTTSAAVPTPSGSGAEIGLTTLGSTGGGNADILPVGMLMVNVTTTTTAYLSAYASFATSTMTAYGYINCIRFH